MRSTRTDPQQGVATATAQLGTAVRKLLAEDVTAERAAALLEIDLAEVRRLSRSTRTTSGQGKQAGGREVR